MATDFNAQIGQNQFIQLLVAQMKSQNPLEPTSNGEFLGQLAQFSTLSAIENLNTNFTELMSLQQLSQGSSLIGRQVAYTNADGQEVIDVVQSLSVSDGKVVLQVGSDLVTLDKVLGVAAAATP